ncbi:sulfotransferase family 2 domain-containing protein [Tamlana crocina]
MVISKKHKFIFIHIPKNAGTSIQEALKSVKEKREHWVVSQTTKHQSLQDLLKIYEDSSWLEKKVKDFDFLNYFKFAVVRNPFERMVSLYNYLNKSKVRNEICSVNGFEHFVHLFEDKNSWVSKLHSAKSQLSYITDLEGKIAADYIGKYEDLSSFKTDIEANFDFKLNLKWLNVSNVHKFDYRSYYSNEIQSIIEKEFLEDLNMFNYNF